MLINQELLKEVLRKSVKNPFYIFRFSFARYLLIGTASVVVDFGSFNILWKLIGIKALYSNLISSLITICFNFTLSNYWTFKAGSRNKFKKLFKFVLVTAFNYFISNFLMYVFIEYTTINLNLAKLFITGLVVCWNFLLYRLWVFKD